MKKLSELVAFAKGIQKLELDDSSVKSSLDDIFGELKSYSGPDYTELEESASQLKTTINQFVKEFDRYKDTVLLDVSEQEKEYFLLSYTIYEEQECDTEEWILNRKNSASINTAEEYSKRILMYDSWKFPGLYIRPKRDQFVNNMISCDPLYIADHTAGLLEPVKQSWTKQFQSRIRYKTIQDSDPQIFKQFPENQFGLIVATDFFDFKPLEIVQKYLHEFDTILRPGGVVIMTYNNCDMPGPVRNVENYFNTYVPGKLLQSIIEGIGYEVLYANESASGTNWIEFKKPGKVQSLRGGQELAQIKDSRLDN